MKNKFLVGSLAIIYIFVQSYLVFADAVTYDFDEVNVLYAAEFTAKPLDGVDISNTWIADIVGEDKKITVLYGVVELKKGGESFITEEFLKVGGEKGSKRFLHNSAIYDYYEGTTTYSQIRSFFWSAKKLEGTSIVKDFTKPIFSASISRKFDESKNLKSFFLSFSNDGEKASQDFWQGESPMYEADTGSIKDSGDETAKGI